MRNSTPLLLNSGKCRVMVSSARALIMLEPSTGAIIGWTSISDLLLLSSATSWLLFHDSASRQFGIVLQHRYHHGIISCFTPPCSVFLARVISIFQAKTTIEWLISSHGFTNLIERTKTKKSRWKSCRHRTEQRPKSRDSSWALSAWAERPERWICC